MVQLLQSMYPKEWEDMVDAYVSAVDRYITKEFRLGDDYRVVRAQNNGLGKTMFCMILSMYGGMRYDDIMRWGDMKSRQAVYSYLVQGYGYMDVEEGFRSIFSKFRVRHSRVVQRIFGIELEPIDGYSDEKIEDVRISSDYMYASVSGVPMRLSLDQWEKMGQLATLTNVVRSGRMVSRKDLFQEKLEKGL